MEKKKSTPTIFTAVAIKARFKPLRAGGITFYREHATLGVQFFFLSDKRRSTWEDFGGKTQEGDISILDTIAREGEEETNKLYTQAKLREALESAPKIFISSGLYLSCLLPWTKGNIKVEKKEKTTGYQRKFRWIKQSNIKKLGKTLHPRLRSKRYFSFLSSLDVSEK